MHNAAPRGTQKVKYNISAITVCTRPSIHVYGLVSWIFLYLVYHFRYFIVVQKLCILLPKCSSRVKISFSSFDTGHLYHQLCRGIL